MPAAAQVGIIIGLLIVWAVMIYAMEKMFMRTDRHKLGRSVEAAAGNGRLLGEE